MPGAASHMSQPPPYPGEGQPRPGDSSANPYGAPYSAGEPPEAPYEPYPGAAASGGYAPGSANPYGQGYGQAAPGGGQGQGSANPYGQGYGQGWDQAASGGYGQGSPSAFGQGSPNAFGQGSPNAYGPSGAPQYPVPGGSQALPTTPAKPTRWPLWTCLGCAVLALILLVVIGGCALLTQGSGGGSTAGPAPATSVPAPVAPTATTPAAPGAAGTVDSPFPVGGGPAPLPTSTDGILDVTLGEVNWDAWSDIHEANQFNDPPGEGEVYVTVPVTVTYHGPDQVSPWIETSISLSAPNGQVYSTTAAVTGQDAISVNDLTDGGTETFVEAFLIPADQARQGAFIVEPLLNFTGDKFYFATA